MDTQGKDIGQADVIETDVYGTATFVEEKTGKGFYAINKRTGLPVGDPAKLIENFAENQILEAGKKKADAILRGVKTRADRNAPVTDINVIKSIKTIRFEIEGNDAYLQQKVEEKLVELRTLYPTLSFEARYGVPKPKKGS